MVYKRTSPPALLVEHFCESGYMRVPNKTRRKKEPRDYKKGYELRFATDTKREIADIRRLLRRAGLKAGRPFKKHSRWIQPVYGKEEMTQFKEWLKRFGPALLVEHFCESGSMRVPNKTRSKKELLDDKKGYELRFVTETKREIAGVRRLLHGAGLKAGEPFKEHSQWIQPVYGRESMTQFKKWLKRFG